MSLQGRRILLAVSGGIAAYKIPLLVRLLRQSGADVRVAMTPAAEEFVTPLTLAALSGSPVERHLVDQIPGRTAWNNHVHMAEWAEALVVAPATSNTIAKAAHGLCDNLVLSLVLSAKCPVFWAPAMDLDMYAYPATRINLDLLRAMGHSVWPSPEGELASGLSGAGRMCEPEFMQRALELHFGTRPFWSGKTLLLTSGPTEESIDPVRFISNGSSGKMGEALAAEAELRGAKVRWIRGPLRRADQTWTDRVHITSVRSASEMHDAALGALEGSDVVIAAAAVADFKPSELRTTKSPKGELASGINLIPTPDILQSLGAQRRPGQVLIGFALETGNGLDSARSKLVRKDADAIVLNYATAETGMDSDTNQITLVTANGVEEGPLESKVAAAQRILDWVERNALKA
jgi:phosphopantothenoylcysteine decarboxylase / phosphopantothenate---cysteine ligase